MRPRDGETEREQHQDDPQEHGPAYWSEQSARRPETFAGPPSGLPGTLHTHLPGLTWPGRRCLDVADNVEHVMSGHVFSKLPKYCVAMKPALLWVRCPECGRPHQEYFGPADRDERNAEMVFLRRELQAASSILLGHRAADATRIGGGGRSRGHG